MEHTNNIKLGDYFKIGNHYILCGDSTDNILVEKFFNNINLKADLIFADPPYGMDKEILNDNLKGNNLLNFNLKFLETINKIKTKNASLYICGQPEVLWKFYFNSDLSNKQKYSLKNEITWDKGDAGAGGVSFIGKADMKSYPISTETILFLFSGNFNTNKDNFNNDYENILNYLLTEYKKSGLRPVDYKRLTGSYMYNHYFSKSQFALISKKHYEILQKETGNFNVNYNELLEQYKNAEKQNINYFNNSHDKMTNVWKYGRVKGKERYNHPTPKPKNLIKRIINSSSIEQNVFCSLFAGSGVDFIACEELNRICCGVEYDPKWVEVILQRLEELGYNRQYLGNIND